MADGAHADLLFRFNFAHGSRAAVMVFAGDSALRFAQIADVPLCGREQRSGRLVRGVFRRVFRLHDLRRLC